MSTNDENEQLRGFYEDAYGDSNTPAALRNGAWRALSARGKAEHVITLCTRARIAPRSILEVGCGDGALLCELHRRGFGGRLEGVEIAQAAVTLARARKEIDSVQAYDGSRLPLDAGTRELGVLSHVLEHVPEPAALLAETARVCRAVVVEVPLEDNLSARRPAKRRHAQEVGHLRRLSRAAMRATVAAAGLRVAAELEDALPREVQRFFAHTARTRLQADVRWGVRTGIHRVAPPLARRLYTVHYACLCVPLHDA
jgi:SAM-dependent methyltransferase